MNKSSSVLTSTGIAMVIAACVFFSFKNNTAGIAFILCGVCLILVSYINPDIIKLKLFGKDSGLTIERNQDTPKEIKLAIKATSEIEADKISEQTEQLVEDTKEIIDAKRSASDYLLLATDNWKSKDYIEALTYAQQGLRLNPESKRLHAALLSRMGTLWDDLKDTTRAEHFYNKAIEIDPKHAGAHYNLGNLLADLDRNEEAEEEYRTAIEIDPKHVPAHNNLGNLLGKLDRNEEAEEEYRRAIKLDPEFAHAHNGLGTLLYKLNRYGEAEEEYRTAIKLDPEYASALRNLKLLQQKL